MIIIYFSTIIEGITCLIILKLFTDVHSEDRDALRWITVFGKNKVIY